MLFAAAASAASPLLGDVDIEALWTMSASMVTAAAVALRRSAWSAPPAASTRVPDPLVEIDTAALTRIEDSDAQAAVVSR